jgi:phosphopantetheine--protein transferase-like protein
MLLGIGIDILNIRRMRDVLESDSDNGSFVNKVFTVKEREQASDHPDPVAYFAMRFAGKEAVFKCFGIDGSGIHLNEIEIRGGETEQPRVRLLGTFREIAEKKGVKDIQISLSYDTDYAVAFAIAQGEQKKGKQ